MNSSTQSPHSLDNDPFQFSFQHNEETSISKHSSSKSKAVYEDAYPSNKLLPNSSKNESYEEPPEQKNDNSKRKSSSSVVIHIKLANNVTKEIICDLNDNVLELAQDFCKENNLSPQAVPVIINMIKQQFSIMLQRMRENPKPQENSGKLDEKKPQQTPGTVKSNHQSVHSGENTAVGSKSNLPADPRGKLLGKLDISIGPNQSKEMLLFEGQDPVEVAFQFCNENNLPMDLIEVLSKRLETIRQMYENSKKKKQEKDPQQHKQSVETKEVEVKQEIRRVQELPVQPHDAYRTTGELNYLPGPMSKAGKERSAEESVNFQKKETADFGREINSRTDFGDNFTVDRNRKELSSINTSQAQANSKESSENQAAESYEKWAFLIKEKLKTKNEQDLPGRPVTSKEPKVSEAKRDGARATNPCPLYKEANALIGNRFPQEKTIQEESVQATEGSLTDRGKRMTKNREEELVRRLYYDELAKKAIVEEIRTAKAERKEEPKEYTFSPRVNKKSPPREGEKRERSPFYDVQPEYVDHRGRVLVEEEIKAKVKQDTYTFKPKISDMSAEIMNNRSRSKSPIHDKLYIEGVQHRIHNEKWRQAMLEEMCPFTPNLPEDIDKHLKNRPKESQQDFINRLVKEAGEKEEKRFKKKLLEDNGRDPSTGQKYFQPVISHDKYYQNLKKREEEENRRNNMNRILEAEANQNLLQYRLGLKEIFDKLDSDKDGFISAQKIDLSQLDREVLEALLDLMGNLESSQTKLDYEGFVQIVSRLKLEEKIFEAMRNKEETFENYESFRQGDRSNSKIMPESEEFARIKKSKASSKKSDFSTASSYQTDNSVMITKHYQEILEKKFLEKNPS